jgi:hypothetical protein
MLPHKEKGKIKEILRELKQNLDEHYTDYQKYFGEDLFHIQMIINNPATLNRSDNSIYENLTTFLKSNPRGGYYLQYGNLHARLNSNWLGNLIYKDFNVTDKVISIGVQYNNCDFWFGKPYKNQTFGVISKSANKVIKNYEQIRSQAGNNSFQFTSVDFFISSPMQLDGNFNYVFSVNNY